MRIRCSEYSNLVPDQRSLHSGGLGILVFYTKCVMPMHLAYEYPFGVSMARPHHRELVAMKIKKDYTNLVPGQNRLISYWTA